MEGNHRVNHAQRRQRRGLTTRSRLQLGVVHFAHEEVCAAVGVDTANSSLSQSKRLFSFYFSVEEIASRT